jgi:hypothetical protein
MTRRRRTENVWGADARARFLAKLATTGNVTTAAKAAGHARKHVFELRAKDENFAAAWDEAMATACDALAEDVRRRACEDIEPGNIDTLLLAQIKAHRPAQRSDSLERTGSESGAPSVKIVPLSEILAAGLKRAEVQGKRVMELSALEETLPQSEQDS